MKNKCLVYVRYSDYGTTKSEQLLGLNDFIKRNDLELVMTLEDQNSMEDLNKVENFKKIFASGSCNVFLIWRLDRLGSASASISESVDFINQLTEMGVRFISASDHIDSENNGGLFLKAIDHAVKSSKFVIKGERVHIALSTAKLLGEAVGRPKERDDLQILELRKDGLTARQIAEKLSTSIRSVSRALSSNAQGLDAPQ